MSAFEDDADDFLRFVRAMDPGTDGRLVRPAPALRRVPRADARDGASARRSVPLIRVAGEVTAVAERRRADLALRDGRRLEAAQDGARRRRTTHPRIRLPRTTGCTGASGTPATPGRPTRSRPIAASRCCCSAPGSRCATSPSRCGTPTRPRRSSPISRRGLLPQPHRVSPKPPPHLEPPAAMDAWPPTALGLLRGLRDEVRPRRGRGGRLARGRHVDPPRHARAVAPARRRGAPALPAPPAPVLGDAPASLLPGDGVRGRGDGRVGRPAARRRAACSPTRRPTAASRCATRPGRATG